MAGGTFDPMVKKVRPGTYINFYTENAESVGASERGITVIPLIDHNYGPAGEFIKLTNASPDAEIAKLGYSVYDSKLLLLREAFKCANTVYAYIINASTVKATATGGGIKATAKYAGSRGNSFKYSITANTVSGFDVCVYLDTDMVSEYKGIENPAALAKLDDPYVDFATVEGSSAFTETASTTLTGGVDVTATNAKYTDFLDGLESIYFNSFAFPVSGDNAESLKAAMKTKVVYLAESCGKRIHAAVPNYVCDCQYIINVTNGVILSDAEIDNVKVCAYVAGLYAGTSYTESNTYKEYEGAVEVLGKKTNEQAIAAINNGEFFFTLSEQGDVVVESDINSLTTFANGVDSSYSKNRVQRVFDTVNSLLQNNFPPNKYNNDETGWDIMEGIGAGILKSLENEGAIKNVDTDNDFLVDRSASAKDYTYFNVYIQPVDSAEKLYFKVKTN